jgi:hypothetical protein
MRPGAFSFRGKWVEAVKSLPETGMGYTVVSVTLHDGRVFRQAVIDSGTLLRVRGMASVPFTEDDIAVIEPTHEKWNWNESP